MLHVMGLSEPGFALVLAGVFFLLIALFLLLLYIDGKRNAGKTAQKERLWHAFRAQADARPLSTKGKSFTFDA